MGLGRGQYGTALQWPMHTAMRRHLRAAASQAAMAGQGSSSSSHRT